MHIPTAMLQGSICPVTAAAGAVGVGAAVYAAAKSAHKPTAGRFAAVTALVFAGQMMNFPVEGGTSGHLLGGVLAAGLLGVPFGVLSLAAVLAVQCLVFADGGLDALGANIVNMALIGAGAGALVRWMAQASALRSLRRLAAAGAVAWLSVVLAAFACTVELAAGGSVSFGTAAGSMLPVHALIGLGEALITVFAFALLAEEPAAKTTARATWASLAGAAVIALALSPFASAEPDGLERAAEQLGILPESAPLFVSPLPDYAFPGMAHEALSTGLAGLAGVLLVFAFAYLLGRAVQIRGGITARA